MKINKKTLVLVIIITLLVSMVSINSEQPKAVENSQFISITATIYPLQEFAEKIGGDKVTVRSIVSEGTDIRDFQPKICDLDLLFKSDLFIYNGFGVEPWIQPLKENLNDYCVKTINTSVNVSPISNGKIVNSNCWLSLNEAKKQAEEIKNALVKVDKNNQSYYEENYKELVDEFDKVFNEYKSKFEVLQKKDFVTTNFKFSYLARDFGLKNNSIQGIGETVTSSTSTEELIKLCKENNVDVIFNDGVENVDKITQLAKDINVSVETLHSLETKIEGMSYLEAMKNNLDTIYYALSK